MPTQGSTTERGYGYPHQRAKRAVTPTVDAGKAWCAEPICELPTRWIQPGTPWDMAHDRANPGHYLGPAHQHCNRVEGIRWRHARRRRNTKPWHSRNW